MSQVTEDSVGFETAYDSYHLSLFFFSSRRRHTRCSRDWSSDVCSSDLVLQELRAHLGRDRARTKAFAVSELGLIEMTRQRVRPSLWQSMTAECPTCHGTGRVFRPEVVVRRMERSLKRAGAEHKERQLAVRLHPDVALYLVEQEPNFLRQLEKQTGLELEVRDDPMMRLDEFRMMAKPAGRDVTELYAVA